MIKRLILIRHAKSSWKYPHLADIDRPLNKRGRHDAPMMGKRLASRGHAVARIITSPALRALRTAQAISSAFDLPVDQLRVDPLLYGASADQLLNRIQNVEDAQSSVALVGHNPDMAMLMEHLSGRPFEHVPTCAVAVFDFDTDSWRQVGDQATEVLFFEFDFPKNIKE